MKTYKINIGESQTLTIRGTLAEARSTLRKINGGRLYGRYDLTETDAKGEGWNLGPNEGCNTATIEVSEEK
jgi:hypothetical protein